jgi:hypothetical protein
MRGPLWRLLQIHPSLLNASNLALGLLLGLTRVDINDNQLSNKLCKEENAGKNLSLYASLEIYTSSAVDVAIFHKKNHRILSSTCKIDSKVKTHSEISKKKIFLDFLDMIYAK